MTPNPLPAIALVTLLGCGLFSGCATQASRAPAAVTRAPGVAAPAPYPSTYRPLPATDTLIRNATVLTGTGARLDAADVLLAAGRIAAVGTSLVAPAGVVVVDGSGKWVTPGIIDVHSHLGVYPSPGVRAHSDGNEMTAPNTAEVWAEHSVWPQDPGFAAALAGGVTSMMILPGSANLIGGRSVTLRNVPARTVQEMKFPGAPYGVKMACGENPKRVYGEGRKTAPATRMGNMAGYRAAFIEARRYLDEQDRYERERARKPDAVPPERDLRSETLAGVLTGGILVHNHCYRADEMAQMLDLAHEFGFRITAFHHAVEAYKIADLLARENTCAAMWADWWGFKMEAFDGIRENIALVEAASACAIVHSDSEIGIQRLNQEAGKALAAGQRMGLALGPEQAITWLTRNPARAIGVLEQTGTLEPGKRADVVLWNRDPFSVYARAERVYVDGALVWDLADPARQPVSDFALGTTEAGGGR
ncbi:MAG: amidohydrolase family protein [Gammaproteobacteria bacterium]|nr:amidohydrolase family protein [Gammaproteobacteria bacterium]